MKTHELKKPQLLTKYRELLKHSKKVETALESFQEKTHTENEYVKIIKSLEQENKHLRALITIKKGVSSSFEIFVEYLCAYYNVTLERLYSHSRDGKNVRPRHMACYFGIEVFKKGTSDIGRVLNRDHASIGYGKNNIDDKLTCDIDIIKETQEHRKWIENNL